MDLATFDTGLLRATIERALRRGGDFAEVFVEDRDSLGLRLEDGRIEQTSGGRETGAAVRLLSGERTYYAYSDAVDEAGLSAAADAVAAAVRAGAQGPEIVDLGAVRADPGQHPVLMPPGEVAIARKAALVRAGDEAARAVSGRDRPGHRRLRRHAPAACSSPTRSATSSSTTARARASSPRWWPVAATSSRRATRRSAAAPASSSSTRRSPAPSPGPPPRRRAHARQQAGAGRRHAGRARQRLRRHALPRGLRPRARGRRHRQGRQHLRRQARRDRRGGHRQRLRRRLHHQRLGLAGVRRRGRADPEDDGHRGRPPDRLPLRPPACPRGGRRRPRATGAASRSATCPSRG